MQRDFERSQHTIQSLWVRKKSHALPEQNITKPPVDKPYSQRKISKFLKRIKQNEHDHLRNAQIKLQDNAKQNLRQHWLEAQYRKC